MPQLHRRAIAELAQCLHTLLTFQQKDRPMDATITQLINSSAVLKNLDARSALIRQAMKANLTAAIAAIAKQNFWQVKTPQHVAGAEPWLFESKTGKLWCAVSKDENFSTGYALGNGVQKLKTLPAINQTAWRLPEPEELRIFAFSSSPPWRQGIGGRLFDRWWWLVSTGGLHLDNNDTYIRNPSGFLLAISDHFCGKTPQFMAFAAGQQWVVTAPGDAKAVDLLKDFNATTRYVRPVFKAIDTLSAKLPALEDPDFTDPAKGLWEFWGLDAAELETLGLRARNPADDVQQGMVAIDFGTSSTVVAFEQNGVGQLLRIGVNDFWEKEKPPHYENPTVLELVDLAALLKPWQSEAYRPGVAWNDVRCSHEALHNFRNNQTKPEVVASVLTKIKQWALREGDGNRVRLTDQTGRIEHELAGLTLRQPVKGQPLTVSATDPFDPVELYAWFLGLTINWRRRGIFLRYYMSFPVAYPSEVKEKILASFRRGLQRSLPATLVTQPVFEQFTVKERASEPAAYAAIALPTLGIAPTEQGVAYAVFDFGGGTADFDFGYYRLATETEERAGIEQVLAHFGNGGDKFLGGENLLEHLAYLTFRHNIEVCRPKHIAFTKPMDALDFSGSEMFLERTQAAATNTLMLVARLRPFWENGSESNTTGVQKIDLIDREGKKVTCEFTVPYPELKAFLQDRIEQGMHNFFEALKKAFAGQLPPQVQVLLAGNASRSNIVLGLFGLLPDDHELAALKERTAACQGKLFGQNCPEFIAHDPLAADDSNINHPTGKTGVALGLLELCPGSATQVVNHAVQQASGDAPFQHYVGRIRQKKFHVSLHQGGSYGQWVALGPVSEDRVFKLYHSQAPRAQSGGMALGDPALILKTLDFAGDTTGLQVLARPIKPHEIEVCTAATLEAAAQGQIGNSCVLKLV